MHGSTGQQNDGNLFRALSVAGIAAFQLAADGRLIDQNDAAKNLIGRFFHITGGRLRPVHGNIAASFERFLSGVSNSSKSEDIIRHMVLRANNGGLAVLARLKSDDVNEAPHNYTFLVFAKTVGADAATLQRILTEDLQLSPAETRLAIALHRYCDLGQAAASLGLSKETVRSQIRAVFAKLGLRKQSEVVRLVEQISSLVLNGDAV